MSEIARKENRVVTDRAIKVIRAVLATDAKFTTQNMIAEKLDVSKQTLSKWMIGESFVTIRDLVRICQRFGASPTYLILGIGEMFIKPNADLHKSTVEMTLADMNNRIGELEITFRKQLNGKKKR